VTDIWYDTEFLEDGHTIELISIGMVREDGARLYMINQELDFGKLLANDWVMENVVPHLPIRLGADGVPEWYLQHKDMPRAVTRRYIQNYVKDFVLELPEPVLWADYGAYDHVVLAQLFGRMIDLPDGFPMWTGDLQQEAARLGYPKLDLDETIGQNEHHALADAEDLRWKHAKLRGIGEKQHRDLETRILAAANFPKALRR
jgi:hypothetical protein